MVTYTPTRSRRPLLLCLADWYMGIARSGRLFTAAHHYADSAHDGNTATRFSWLG